MEISLRPWKHDDIDTLISIANNFNIAKNLTDKFPYPYTRADGERFIEYAINSKSSHLFAIDLQGTAIGGIGIHPQDDIYRKNAEIGFWLAESHWGNGYMRIAISKITTYTFQTIEIERIYARVFEKNIASQRVLQKSGFQLDGKFQKTIFKNNEFLDEYIYSLRKTPFNE